jgi:prepilin-type N-terminal cleavage/methylation domain-containing protein
VSRAGFTLVEVVVALTVASLLALAAYRGAAVLGELGARAAARREVVLREFAIRRQLTDWLRSAHLATDSLSAVFEGHDRVTADGVADDVVAFPTLAPGPFRSGRVLVGLRIDRDPVTPQRGVVALLVDAGGGGAAAVAGRGEPWAGAVRADTVSLVPEATGLDIRYRFHVEKNPVWFDGWISAVRLPEAAELRMLGDSVPPLLRLPVLVPIGGGD